MIDYFLRRLGGGILAVLGVFVVSFLIIHLAPGDPTSFMLASGAPVDNIEQLRRAWGLDRPLPVQFWRYLSRLVQGDLGVSIHSGVPVLELIRERIPLSGILALGALLLSVAIGIPIGIIAALRRDTIFDYGTISVTLLALSTPGYWNGLLLILLFAVALRWFPVSGTASISNGIVPYLHHLTLPWLSLSLPTLGMIARLVRTEMLETLGADYIRTARSKGLPDRVVVYRHALRNAMIPVITVVGLQMGTLMGGVVFTETVFSLPGLGRLVTRAIVFRDYPIVLGSLVVVAAFVVLINVVTDFLYTLADPRVRYG